jgi:regulator of sirC expression with transglutaminase-like and TPR domain
MDLDEALNQLAQDPAAPLDVAELALLLARDEYPCLDVEAHLAELDAMAHDARPYVRGNLEIRVAGLCRCLFHELGFHGNTQDYYDPRNSYLNDVLERRTGIPITLSVIVMAVGARVGLDIQGVGLPAHFVVKAVEGNQEVLFDPFHSGRRITPACCELLVQEATGRPFEATPANLAGVPLAMLLQRLLNNLKIIYLRTEDFARAGRVIERLRQLDPDDPSLHRDLGACMVRTGQQGKAIDHFDAYLRDLPNAGDADDVRRLLNQARQQIAQWN